MNVAVVGAGIVGSAVARELAGRGADVTIYEQTAPGAGTSSTTFAWVNSHDKWPEAYHALNLAGCAEHRRLADGRGDGPGWYVGSGNLVWADDTGRERLEARMGRLEAAGYPGRWIDSDEAAALEPDVRFQAGIDRLAYFPEEAYVLPTVLLAHLLGEARDRGAVLRCPAQVRSIEADASGVEVVLGSGERQRFDRVVSCAGRWTEPLAATSGLHVPLVDPEEAGGAAVGFLAYTSPVPARVSRVLTSPRLNVRPDGGGRLVLQGLDLDAAADPADVPGAESAIADDLLGRLHELLEIDGTVAVEDVRVGQRALPADGLTVAGFDEAGENRVYTVATHSGVTLGPLLGRLVADEVLGDGEADLLRDFRPGRFSAAASPAASPISVSAARLPGEQ